MTAAPEPVSAETPTRFMPPRWVITTAWRVHRAMYRWSGGRFGLRRPRPGRDGLAALTTVGRRTGEDRQVMIAYYEHGELFITMAMNGWASDEPAWWLNLQAASTATLTLHDRELRVTGRAATADERPELWRRWGEIDSHLDGWAARRTGETAVVILTPSDESGTVTIDA